MRLRGHVVRCDPRRELSACYVTISDLRLYAWKSILKLSTLRDRVSTLESAAEYKDNEIEQLRKELQDERRERVRSDLLAERYSRKADIIIRGLPYNKEENCEVLLDDFLVGELGFDKSTPLVTVHRLSRPTKTRPNPPLLARLVNFHDRDRILKEGHKLRGTGFAVYEHLPPPLQAARAQLIPVQDAEIAKVKDTNTDYYDKRLSEQQMQACEGLITEDELLNAINSFSNGKSPGRDGIPVEVTRSCVTLPRCSSLFRLGVLPGSGAWETCNLRGAYDTWEITRYDISLAGLCEVRWPGNGETVAGDHCLFWSGPEDRTGLYGVALAIPKQLRGSLLSWKPVSDRLLTARLLHQHGKMTVIVAYGPTDVAPDQDKDLFFDQLQELVQDAPQHDITIVLTDANATLCQASRSASSQNVLGPISADPSTNDNGSRLLDLCRATNMSIADSWFPRKRIHHWTWYSPDGRTRKAIDHILISARWKSCITNCRVYRGAQLANTDHRLLVAHMRMKLKADPTAKKERRIDSSQLLDPLIQEKYMCSISNRFNALTQDETADWQNFKTEVLKAAEETVGRSRPAPKKPWISHETLHIIDYRRAARLRGDMTEYRRLNRERNSAIRRDRETFWADQATSLEEAAQRDDQHQNSEWFQINSGVRQGCVAAPDLFNCVVDYLMSKVSECVPGVSFGGYSLADLEYADDTTLLADTPQRLRDALVVFDAEASKLGLSINWSKTELMHIGDGPDPAPLSFNNTTVNFVSTFNYLGSTVSRTGDLKPEIDRRRGLAAAAMQALWRPLWKHRHISLGTKLRVYNAAVVSILLYGAETWPLSNTLAARLDGFDSRCLRRILGVRWFDHLPGTELRQRTQQPPASRVAAMRRVRWYGHVLRLPPDHPTRAILNFSPQSAGWKRPRGAPRTRWTDVLAKDLALVNITPEEAQGLAQNRSRWREVARLVETVLTHFAPSETVGRPDFHTPLVWTGTTNKTDSAKN
ncbi:hypothetical protein Bbelb_253690 [Branchiostoma belcheri]|nr:hypothetical protein Bbelb_253690 [Branchiostoma belcheri]